ncbi:recombinase family protein [Streptomyces sp. FL07-04A]|uniref:recombinase family protein n=1 Tax=Streptomyces sp. FL07-04A TaxID=3028658 RepID=UPI0029A19B88|nr:recombinase family protein [Streptomyces sp. FL07-04A]MDX3579408.1 recombinase family protein [Streptomyces sp. FL07-04A]
MKPVRVLIALRISNETDASTSLERQLQDCSAYVNERQHLGWQVVGVARDAHISATKSHPFERPELGEWLNNRAPEFDLLLFWKMDRFVRKVVDMQDMIKWATAHGGKALVSVKEPVLDMIGPFRHVIIDLFAAIAETEAQNISMRVKSFQSYAKSKNVWAKGNPPYGYESFRDTDGAMRLRVRENQRQVILEIYKRVVEDGEPYSTICDDFNARGIASPAGERMSDRRKKNGTSVPVWRGRTITNILRSETILGWKCEEVKVPGKKYGVSQAILTSEGKVRMADPILTDDEWAKLQDEMNGRPGAARRSTKNTTAYRGVVLCGGCGKNLYLFNPERQQGKPVYRCNKSANRDSCGKGYAFRAEKVEELVETMILGTIGDFPMHERHYVKGSNNSQRLREIEEYVTELQRSLRPGGKNSSGFAKKATEEEIAALYEEHDSLAAEGDKPDRYEYRDTGETFRHMWERNKGNEVERTRHLLKAGITIRLNPLTKGVSNTTDFGGEVHLGNRSEPFTIH